MVLALVTATGVVWVAVPMILLLPFGAQTAGGLAVSYAMRARGGLNRPIAPETQEMLAVPSWKRRPISIDLQYS